MPPSGVAGFDRDMHDRRSFLIGGAGATAFVVAGYRPLGEMDSARPGNFGGPRVVDLNPDRMWPVYRRYHLLLVGPRDDERGSAVATAAVDVLARFLPESRALLVRAADARRIGVLIATEQQDVGVMSAESAEALFLAKPPFADIRDAPLRVIVSFGSHVLVCRPDFKPHHAYLLAQTLAAHGDALPAPAVAPTGAVPVHAGAHAFFAGEEPPP